MSGIPQIVGRACLEISSVTPALLVRRPLPSSARHEAKLCVVQTARTSRSEALVSDHCSTKETTLSGIGASTKRPLVSGAPNPPPAPTKPKTTKRAHYENNRSRRAEPRQWTPAEGSRSCGDPRCARPPSTPSTVEWPTFFSGRRCGKPSAMSHGHSWAQFFERRAGAGWRCVADTGGNPPPLASHGSESSSWRTATGLAGFQTKSHGSAVSWGYNASPPQRPGRVVHRLVGRLRAQHTVSLGFAVVPRRVQRAKPHVATIRIHLPGQSTCFSTARPGTVEFQLGPLVAIAPRKLPKELREWSAINGRTSNSSGGTGALSRVDGESTHVAKLEQLRAASAPLLNLAAHHTKRSLHTAAGARCRWFADIGVPKLALALVSWQEHKLAGQCWLSVAARQVLAVHWERAWRRMILVWLVSHLPNR